MNTHIGSKLTVKGSFVNLEPSKKPDFLIRAVSRPFETL